MLIEVGSDGPIWGELELKAEVNAHFVLGPAAIPEGIAVERRKVRRVPTAHQNRLCVVFL